MRYVLYGVVIVIALIVLIKLIKFVKKSLIGVIFGIFVLVCTVPALFKVINVNTIPEELKLVLDTIVEETGSSEYVRVNSSDEIELLVDDDWVCISDIAIVSSVTDDITLEYNGMEVEVMDSGVVSAIKVLEKLGILE